MLLRRRALLLALIFISIAGPSAAQDAPELAAQEPFRQSPLELLLEHRDSLGLTADQLARLDEIRQELAARNEPLIDRMLRLRNEWQEARRSARSGAGRLERIRTAAEPIRARIQRHNREAMQAVRRMLTPAQREHLRDIVEERRAPPRDGPAGVAGTPPSDR